MGSLVGELSTLRCQSPVAPIRVSCGSTRAPAAGYDLFVLLRMIVQLWARSY
jgi:hypothetical protein